MLPLCFQDVQCIFSAVIKIGMQVDECDVVDPLVTMILNVFEFPYHCVKWYENKKPRTKIRPDRWSYSSQTVFSNVKYSTDVIAFFLILGLFSSTKGRTSCLWDR